MTSILPVAPLTVFPGPTHPLRLCKSLFLLLPWDSLPWITLYTQRPSGHSLTPSLLHLSFPASPLNTFCIFRLSFFFYQNVKQGHVCFVAGYMTPRTLPASEHTIQISCRSELIPDEKQWLALVSTSISIFICV